jgi:hypothetical protein
MGYVCEIIDGINFTRNLLLTHKRLDSGVVAAGQRYNSARCSARLVTVEPVFRVASVQRHSKPRAHWLRGRAAAFLREKRCTLPSAACRSTSMRVAEHGGYLSALGCGIADARVKRREVSSESWANQPQALSTSTNRSRRCHTMPRRLQFWQLSGRVTDAICAKSEILPISITHQNKESVLKILKLIGSYCSKLPQPFFNAA